MEEILQIVALAFLVEAVWETLKMTWEEDKVNIDKVGALLVGVLVAVVYQYDLLIILGLTNKFNFIGAFLTGILISRGGNFIHDVIQKVGGE